MAGAVRNGLARAGRGLRAGWLVLGLTLALLLLLELAARLALGAYTAGRGLDLRANADCYAGLSWVQDYFAELNRVEMAWSPYVYWRAKPCSGQYVNVDENGWRRTWQDTAPAAGRPVKRVFMFGGSVLWGQGARDDFTIPSGVARQLAGDPRAVWQVTNMAQGGYVSTQGVAALLLELRRGNIPDAVVLFDGVNDIYAAFQSGAAGEPMNEGNRRAEFNLLNDSRQGDLFRAAGLSLTSSGLYQVARRGLRKVLPERQLAAGPPPERREELAREVVAHYRSNLALVAAAGRAHGFAVHCYWQPMVYSKSQPTAYEQMVGGQKEVRLVRDFFLQVYAAVAADTGLAANRDFADLAAACDGFTTTCFLDWVHLSEPANELLAGRMAADLLRRRAD